MELPPRGVHFLAAMEPLVLARDGVEGALLKPAESHREPRPELLQPRTRRAARFLAVVVAAFVFLDAIEDVPMVPHKNEIALVVESDDLPTFELPCGRCETSMPLQTLLFSDSTIKCVNLLFDANWQICLTANWRRG